MKYHFPYGTERWFKWTGDGDVRSHRPQKGWEAMAWLRDTHPITAKPFKTAQWWIREIFTGE